MYYTVISVPAWMMIGFWALQQFLNTYLTIARVGQNSGIAYAAHAGGFLAGVILALIYRNAGSRPVSGGDRYRQY
jgi:membrane associated rhomboid family serine protease